MTKNVRAKKSSSRELRLAPYQIPHNHWRIENVAREKCSWEDAICPVCMECPHNAVLLLCSSHNNGCRPYICATNYQHSKCLDELIEACRNQRTTEGLGSIEFTCPLCRGEVKGYTLVEPAREHLNHKSRSCMQDGCTYMGTYRELSKHIKRKHPSAKPRKVDPLHACRWRLLTLRSALQDMICSARSLMLRRLLSALLQDGENTPFDWREDGNHHVAASDS